MKEKVLVLFSGGMDSLLTACKIVEEGYKAILVHYDNGCSCGSQYVKETANRLIERYGKDSVEFWGIGVTAGYYYAFQGLIANKTNRDFLEQYPHLIYNQLNCLSCRTAMYIFSIALCQQLNIHKIAEGARKSQLFAIEQEDMIIEFKSFLQEFGIELLIPVYNLVSDFEREVLLMIRNINPKVMEPKCLHVVSMNRPLSKEEIEDVVHFFRQELLEPSLRLIKESEKIPLDNRGKMF